MNSKFSLVVAMGLVAGLSAQAMDLTFKAGVVNNKSVQVFELKNDELVQTSGHVEQKLNVRGTGALALVRKSKSQVDDSVPGIGEAGHSRLNLSRNANGKIYLQVDRLVDKPIAGVQVKSAVRYDAEAVLTKGTWEDYLAGRPVKLKLTPEGQKAATDAVAADMQKVFAAKSKELGGANAWVKKITVEGINAKGVTLISGDRNRLQLDGAKTETKLTLLLSTDPRPAVRDDEEDAEVAKASPEEEAARRAEMERIMEEARRIEEEIDAIRNGAH